MHTHFSIADLIVVIMHTHFSIADILDTRHTHFSIADILDTRRTLITNYMNYQIF
jgi:hypothetical protein